MNAAGLFTDHISLYTSGDDARRTGLLRDSNAMGVVLGIGAQPFTWEFPLDLAVGETSLTSLFLNEIFFLIVGVLVILAVILMYSLLLSSVQAKTFEYGMLRALGLTKELLVLLLSVQSLYFVVPGVLMGFMVSFIVFVPVDFAISQITTAPMSTDFTTDAWVLGLVLGLAAPFMGILLPVRAALDQSLHAALDVAHNVAFDTVVKFSKLRAQGMSWTEIIIAAILIGLGMVVYYVIPLSYIYSNDSMFITTFAVVLLTMIMGLALLAQTLDYLLQVAFVWLLTSPIDPVLRPLVVKNLSGHRDRNKKTALMFTLCLGFIIFGLTMFSLQTDTVTRTLEWTYGAQIVVSSSDSLYPLPEADLRAYLQTKLFSNVSAPEAARIVVNYTFVTPPLDSLPFIQSVQISAISSSWSEKVTIYGVEEDYLATAFEGYTQVDVANVDFQDGDPIAALYNRSVPLPSDTGSLPLPVGPPVFFFFSSSSVVCLFVDLIFMFCFHVL